MRRTKAQLSLVFSGNFMNGAIMNIIATNAMNAVAAYWIIPGCFPSSLLTDSEVSHSPYVIRIMIAAMNQKNTTLPIIFHHCGNDVPPA